MNASPLQFQLLSEPYTPKRKLGALYQLFQQCRQLYCSLLADVQAGHLNARFCIKSSVERSKMIDELCAAIREDYRMDMRSPFEGIESIAGGVWAGTEILDGDDALLKLKFAAGTSRLPLHTHDFSDRIIFVVAGAGAFEVAPDMKDSESTQVCSVPVSCGDILAFSRDILHTFKTGCDELLLLSYHAPFIALDDPRQFTVPDLS